MARFLLCWEFGGGLGHAGRFKPLAQELIRRGHHVDLMLREIVHTRSLLGDLGVRIVQAPMWTHQTVGLPSPVISLAEILAGNGYLRADALAGLVAGWQGVMEMAQPDVVVADYAPTANIAARIQGIPVATVGIGFYLPPDAAPLPPFRTWEPIQAGRVEHFDQLVCTSVNTVLAEQGAQPVAKLADIFRGDLPLLCTWPELDHYKRGALPEGQLYHGPTFLPSGGEAPAWPQGDGPKVFAYVRGSHPDHAALLQALDQMGCGTLCYMPEVAAGKPEPVSSPRIRYAKAPVHLGEAFTQCQAVVCHAGEATLAQAILAGVPVLLMPTQAEQFLMAMRVEECGAGINVSTRPRPTPFKDLLTTLLNKPDHATQAKAMATRYQAFTHEAQTHSLVDAFESLLQPHQAV
jgi:UDP:flavonoid glycosyltransferase YjiC (YdhE family)